MVQTGSAGSGTIIASAGGTINGNASPWTPPGLATAFQAMTFRSNGNSWYATTT